MTGMKSSGAEDLLHHHTADLRREAERLRARVAEQDRDLIALRDALTGANARELELDAQLRTSRALTKEMAAELTKLRPAHARMTQDLARAEAELAEIRSAVGVGLSARGAHPACGKQDAQGFLCLRDSGHAGACEHSLGARR